MRTWAVICVGLVIAACESGPQLLSADGAADLQADGAEVPQDLVQAPDSTGPYDPGAALDVGIDSDAGPDAATDAGLDGGDSGPGKDASPITPDANGTELANPGAADAQVVDADVAPMACDVGKPASPCSVWQLDSSGNCAAAPLLEGTKCGAAVPTGCAQDQLACDDVGNCVAQPLPAGTPCWVTALKLCPPVAGVCDTAGVCQGPYPGPAAACADSACQLKVCDALGVCTGKAAPKGTPCEVAWDDDCSAGFGVCDAAGKCIELYQPAGVTCFPGPYQVKNSQWQCGAEWKCTTQGICDSTVKYADGKPCGASSMCGVSACANGRCAVTKVLPTGASCASGCFKTAKCDKAGFCIPSEFDLAACDDGNGCTKDVCCEGLGYFQPWAANSGDNVCGSDSAGKCDHGKGSPVLTKCAQDQPCTGFWCSGGQCVAYKSSNPAGCEQKDPCTSWGCFAGQCTDYNPPGGKLNCNDGNSCTIDACSMGKSCLFTAVADGTACGVGGTCQKGVCLVP